MPEINPIEGPIGPKEDPHKRDQKVGSPEKFKEHYRVEAVDGTDTEDQAKKKKKKNPGIDDDDEDKLDGIAAPTNTPNTNLASSPFEVQPPEKKVSASSSTSADHSGNSYGNSYSPTGSFAAHGDEGDTDDPFTQNLPNAPTPNPNNQNRANNPTSQPPSPTQSPQEPDEGMSFSGSDFATGQATSDDAYDQDNPAQPPTTTTPSSQTPSSQTPSSTTSTSPSSNVPSEATPVPAVGKSQASKDAKTGDKDPSLESVKKGNESLKTTPTSTTSSDKPTAPSQPPSPQKTEEKLSQAPPINPGQAAPVPPPSKNKELTPEEAGLSWDDDMQPVSEITSESTSRDKKEGNDQDKDDGSAQAMPNALDIPAPFSLDSPAAAQGALPTYTTFSPAVLEMFDKMVGTISVLQESSGERKTTITLTSPNFASSAFYGAEIVIEEDLHLAPGQYNIRLVGSPEAVSLFQAKSDDLLAAFQSGNYNFKVQRLETAIQTTDKPLFKRKEGVGGDSDDGQGKNP